MVKIRKRDSSLDTISIGGLHKDDFEWVSKQHEAFDYIFVGFVLDVDGYHWKAVYAKADILEKSY